MTRMQISGLFDCGCHLVVLAQEHLCTRHITSSIYSRTFFYWIYALTDMGTDQIACNTSEVKPDPFKSKNTLSFYSKARSSFVHTEARIRKVFN